MTITKTYGRRKPEDGDKGSTFFDDLEHNIDLNDAHTHNGVDSAKLPSTSFTKTTQSILAAGWSAVAGKDIYKQTVTVPTGLDRTKTNGVEVCFKDTDTGHNLLLSIEWVSDTTFDVFINDNTKNVTVIYL